MSLLGWFVLGRVNQGGGLFDFNWLIKACHVCLLFSLLSDGVGPLPHGSGQHVHLVVGVQQIVKHYISDSRIPLHHLLTRIELQLPKLILLVLNYNYVQALLLTRLIHSAVVEAEPVERLLLLLVFVKVEMFARQDAERLLPSGKDT